MRLHVVSVRLTPAELVAWRAAAEVDRGKEVATWARSRAAEIVAAWPTVVGAWDGSSRPGALGYVDGPRPRAWAWGVASSAAERWNHDVKRLHTTGTLDADGVDAVCQWTVEAAREIVPVRVRPEVVGWTPTGKQSRLVNIRLDTYEQEAWLDVARVDGWARPGAWCRAVVGASIGIKVQPAGMLPVSSEYTYVHHQIVGIMMNLAQAIGSGRVDEPARVQLRAAQERTQEILHRLNAARVP